MSIVCVHYTGHVGIASGCLFVAALRRNSLQGSSNDPDMLKINGEWDEALTKKNNEVISIMACSWPVHDLFMTCSWPVRK